MVYITSKIIGKKRRFFLAKSIRIGKEVKKILIPVGDKEPGKTGIDKLKETLDPLICIKEAKLKAQYTSKRYRSEFFNPGEIQKLEILRLYYKNYLHKLNPGELEKYMENFLVRYVYNTTGIEGNSTTLPETAQILIKKITPSGKNIREIYEIANYEKLIEFMDAYSGDISKKLILGIHSIILKNIDDDNAGRFRNIKVHIIGSDLKLPDPGQIEQKMDDLIRHYYASKKETYPLETAAIFHHKFERIHPFVDGNGRVGRELLNFILKKCDFPPVILEVKHRQEYIRALMSADKGNYERLIRFITDTLYRQYDDLLKTGEEDAKKSLPDTIQ